MDVSLTKNGQYRASIYYRELLGRAIRRSGVWGGSGILASGLLGVIVAWLSHQTFWALVGVTLGATLLWAVIATILEAPVMYFQGAREGKTAMDSVASERDSLRATLIAEMDERARKAALRTELGKWLEGGSELTVMLQKGEETDEYLTKCFAAWTVGTKHVLEEADPSYVSQFVSAHIEEVNAAFVRKNQRILDLFANTKARMNVLTVLIDGLR